ncbi:transposase [Bdellovibrionota bacterium FG-2]
MDPNRFFKSPQTAGQKQYEALRAFYVDHVPGKEVTRRFGYSYAAFNSLKQRFKSEKLKFFMTPPPGPKGPRLEPEVRSQIIEFRKKGVSAHQIAEILETLGKPTSVSTIARVLEKEGFPKLARRTQLKIGLTRDNTIVPASAVSLKGDQLDGWEGETAMGGIFLFAPLLEQFGLPKLVGHLPASAKISALSYVFSMLALKLVGKERLSQVDDFNFDCGLGLFAGLNVLPKCTAISTYSYRLSSRHIHEFMQGFVERQNHVKTYGSDTINLDFHTIQHYGEEAILEEHWSGARSRRVKGATTIIAQDCDSKCQIYVDADILKSEADDQILKFVTFWRGIRGPRFKQTLVFDSKLTTYENLKALDADGVRFITLRRRGKNLVKDAENIPAEEWKRVTIESARRKYKNPVVYDAKTNIKGYGEIRQLIMKGNGREEPAFFVTNDQEASTAEIILRYSKRWRVENSIEEAVSFFNLNALSSPILIKINFDVVLTMIAATLYYHLAKSLRGFESCNAERVFRHFVDMPAKIQIKGDEIHVHYPLRAHSPVLRSAGLENWAPPISWLGNRKLRFSWGEAVSI